MKLLVLGATGMAGHTIALYLSEQRHQVTTFSKRAFLLCNNVIGNAFETKKISDLINKEKYDAIINCIGILNGNAEKDTFNAVYLNSLFPHFLSKEIVSIPTKLIHISTDCVFSGKTGSYKEESHTDGNTFYAKSKALGEVIDDKNLTLRTSIIGPDINYNGIGLFNWFMKQQNSISGYEKVIWSGVTTLVLAQAIENVLSQDITGLYHLVNNTTISKYELLNLFNKHFMHDKLNIGKQNDIVNDKSIINTRTDFNFVIPSYEEMIKDMKRWILKHKEIYPHYTI
jgi:dTDP-4-dehydrorhamnose reductase